VEHLAQQQHALVGHNNPGLQHGVEH
jgi:hypothetical protein